MTRQLVNLRLPPELVARIDAEAERLGQTRTKFVERALESALGDEQGGGPSGNGPRGRAPAPAPTRASDVPPAVVKAAAAEESMRQYYVEGTDERAEKAAPRPKLPAGVKTAREVASRSYACPKANCIYVSDKPGVCVHHRTERLK